MDSFANKKGIPVTPIVIEKLTKEQHCRDTRALYPQLGPNTTQKDLDEALFVCGHQTSTYQDIQRYRQLSSKDDYKDGEWT